MANAYDYITDDQEIEPEGEAMPEKQGAMGLLRFIQSTNLAAELDEDEIAPIAGRVVREYEIDKTSREHWEERTKDALELAMLTSEEKSYPWPKASNVKYPLLTTAALQFNARAYPAIVMGNRVAKCQVWGEDPDGNKAERADRVSEHLSYQLLAELPEWEEDTDRLLVMLPITGCVFRKVYYDPSLGRNTTRLVTADRLVVNYRARSMEDAPRITEEMYLYPYEIEERIRSKRFIEFDYGQASPEAGNDDKQEIDQDDHDAPHLFLEQHRLLDLDGDGYPEPYIVTVHKASETVCRIVANYTVDSVMTDEGMNILAIRKQDYYVKYQFLPSPDGGFYGWGFGWLLKDITESINTTLNQMLDAGHLSNVQGGLVSSQLGIKEKSIRLKPGEYKVINHSGRMSDSVLPINYPGPSAVLFNLLGLLVETGKEVAAIKDVLTGEGQGKNASPTTTLALIEQGLQVFTSIYKRIFRSLKAELGLHARLNREYLDPESYNKLFDAEQPADPAKDYDEADMDILPVSDPNMVSRMQQLAKAEFLKAYSAENPALNPLEVTQRVLEAAQIDEPEKLIMPPPEPSEMEKQLMALAADLEMKDKQADIAKKMASAIKDIAAAEGEEAGQQMAFYQMVLSTLDKELNGEQRAEEMAMRQQEAAMPQASNGQG